MFLRSIRVQDFRNLQGEIDWGKGTNVIYGNNGQGKTNWLEAVHFLAHAKSFRTRHPHEAIRFGKTAASQGKKNWLEAGHFFAHAKTISNRPPPAALKV